MEDKDRADGGQKFEVLVLVRVPQSQTTWFVCHVAQARHSPTKWRTELVL